MDADFREQHQEECKYRLGAFTGGRRGGLFGGRTQLLVFFTVSGLARIYSGFTDPLRWYIVQCRLSGGV
jgi:hypothetical protein